MTSRTRNAAIVCVAASLVFGLLVVAPLLYELPIGLDSSAFPAGEAIQAFFTSFEPDLARAVAGTVWLAILLIAVGAAAFVVARHSARAKIEDQSRRTFLTGTASGVGVALLSMMAATAAAFTRAFLSPGRDQSWRDVLAGIVNAEVVKTHSEWKEAWKGSRVRAYRRLGRTGWEVSDIVLGTGRIRGENGERIAREAIDRGVNYFDTSPDYSGAGSEDAMGRAIQGVRDRMFIATKFCTPTGHLPAGTPVARYKRAVEESLRRLRTDYVDLCHIHSVDQVARLMDENVHEAFDQLQQEGKVRFLGFSTHTPNLIEVANTAISSGRFDVMMLAYHHGIWAPLDDIIARGRREQDMGVVAMKTLKGAKQNGLAGFREHADAYSQAALRWVLSNRDVSCAVISFFEMQHVDEYLYASGGALDRTDLAVLREYDRRIAGSHCQQHCGACLDSCPEGVPIHDVLRQRMYFEDYGQEKEAMRLYARLEKNASACASCSGPCLGSCPGGIAIPERTRQAHELLTLS